MADDKLPPTDRCNAPDKKRNGEPCRRKAGYNTLHIGYGRCSKHGGTLDKTILPRPATLKELTLVRSQDKDIYDLRQELSLSRAITEYIQKMITEEDDDDNISLHLKSLNMFLNTTTKIAEKMQQIEESRKGFLSIEEVKEVMDKFVNIILSEVEDTDLQERILDKILGVHIDKAISVPPDDAKYADEWAMVHTESERRMDKGEEVLSSLKDTVLNEESSTTDQTESERLSLAQYHSRLQITQPRPKVAEPVDLENVSGAIHLPPLQETD